MYVFWFPRRYLLSPSVNFLYHRKMHHHISRPTCPRIKMFAVMFGWVQRPCLCRGTADEEPLVNGAVDLLRGQLLVGRQGRQLLGSDAAGRVGGSQVGTRRGQGQLTCSFVHIRSGCYLRGDVAGLGLAGDQLLPSLGALTDHVHGVASKRKKVLSALLIFLAESTQPEKKTHLLFLHSPVKANWFSGFPSGIL